MAAIAATIVLLVGRAEAGPPAAPNSSGHRLPGPEEVIAAKTDLWGEAALRQPGGPTYEFFAGLLPPLRYVDADFLHYPIVLSAPGSPAKARLVSNGSAINALARQPNWKNETGIPVHVRVGRSREPFGADLARLDGPRYADGFLPIVQLHYTHDGAGYEEEAFAAVEEPLAAAGTAVVRFGFPARDRGQIDLRFEYGSELLIARGGMIRDRAGQVLAAYDGNWEWNPSRNLLISKTEHDPAAYVTIFTHPIDAAAAPAAGRDFYYRQRDLCARRWRALLADGMTVDVPEPYVNNAWRSLIVGTYAILSGDDLNYSASNQYARKYANESGEALRSLVVWGHAADLARAIRPLFVYRRPNLEYHDGTLKLRLLADYYFITRDQELIRETRPLWQKEIDLILDNRDPSTGLLPREKYCSDIDTRVRSLRTNANAWRGLRDMALVLDDLGEREQAERLAAIAADYRRIILATLDKVTVRTVDPPFVPIALDGEEPVPDPITGTRLGSYWNLVVQSLLGSGVFRYDSATATDILRYLQTNGGLCMGLLRVQSARPFWVNVQNIDDLYGVRYALLLQQRDEPDRALVSFYGKLAQGMTRDTFISGESSGILPWDRFGRQMALPPNSAGNASFLQQLRGLLVQDWDMDDDGKVETLRLLFATPRHWLRDGARIVIQRAPTAFGDVSIAIHSALSADRIIAVVDLPVRQAPAQTLLRLRLPDGLRFRSAHADGQPVPTAGPETLDLSGLSGRVQVEVLIRRPPP
ncbi:MAG: hypothetical protein IRY99_14685 [Isosphaeraceae bacterium]|nr:hypothetical protein [Isosphaeraceae bacterium]